MKKKEKMQQILFSLPWYKKNRIKTRKKNFKNLKKICLLTVLLSSILARNKTKKLPPFYDYDTANDIPSFPADKN